MYKRKLIVFNTARTEEGHVPRHEIRRAETCVD